MRLFSYIYKMNVKEIRMRLKSMGSFELEKDLFKYVKNEIPHIILSMNIEQLFVYGEDNDGIDLGYYSVDHPEKKKKRGQSFDMFDSGKMMFGMRVDIKYRKIIITSDTPDLKLIESNPAFNSTDFFGLNEDNYNKFVKKFINPFVIKWYKKKLNIT